MSSLGLLSSKILSLIFSQLLSISACFIGSIEILNSNIIEKKNETDQNICSCNKEDVENDSKPIYNQTVFFKHLLDHVKHNPNSAAACNGKAVLSSFKYFLY